MHHDATNLPASISIQVNIKKQTERGFKQSSKGFEDTDTPMNQTHHRRHRYWPMLKLATGAQCPTQKRYAARTYICGCNTERRKDQSKQFKE